MEEGEEADLCDNIEDTQTLKNYESSSDQMVAFLLHVTCQFTEILEDIRQHVLMASKSSCEFLGFHDCHSVPSQPRET